MAIAFDEDIEGMDDLIRCVEEEERAYEQSKKLPVVKSEYPVDMPPLEENPEPPIQPIAPENMIKALSPEQKCVYDAVFRRKNVFVTGPGGCGKSFLLSAITKGARDMGIKVSVTASTGIAATNVRGGTIHSFAGIGKGEGTVQDVVNLVKHKFMKKKQWKEIGMLIIDEISMISGLLFQKLDYVAREYRGKPDTPFGGLQLVIFGDFCQLPPVNDVKNGRGDNGTFAFETESWSKTIQEVYHLTKSFRQRDAKFVGMLNRIRLGKQTPEDIQILKSREGPNATIFAGEGIKPTRIFPLNTQADEVNRAELMKLPGREITFKAIKEVHGVYDQERVRQIKEGMMERLLAVEELHLKVGAQVMLLVNKDLVNNLANGSKGVVIGFVKNDKSETLFPQVKFEGGFVKVIDRYTWDIGNEYSEYTGTVNQIPLRLAWASKYLLYHNWLTFLL